MSCWCISADYGCYDCEMKIKAKRIKISDRIKLRKYFKLLEAKEKSERVNKLTIYFMEKNIDVGLVEYFN